MVTHKRGIPRRRPGWPPATGTRSHWGEKHGHEEDQGAESVLVSHRSILSAQRPRPPYRRCRTKNPIMPPISSALAMVERPATVGGKTPRPGAAFTP